MKKMNFEEAIDVIRMNTPPLECPKCGADDSNCVVDGLIKVDYPDGGGGAEIVYRYQCPNCKTHFNEIFYRVKVEKN
jgi:transposase-like protein